MKKPKKLAKKKARAKKVKKASSMEPGLRAFLAAPDDPSRQVSGSGGDSLANRLVARTE